MNARGPSHPVLEDAPGATACLLGNVAIVRGALEAGVQFVSGYPGTPASEVGDTFARIAGEAGVLFEYSVNEKVAVEIAFGAALTGARSLCSMKHLGLNYAGDPIATMPYVGVEGGMVIVSAGDPSLVTSPNEQDQRHLSRFLFYPIFDPATPEDARKMTRAAFELSEATRLPVILRPTTRVCHTSGRVELGPLPRTRNPIRFEKAPERYVPLPENARRMRKEVTERYSLAKEWLGRSDFFPRTGRGNRGIIASGVATAYVRQVVSELHVEKEISLLQIGAYPIPETVLEGFLQSVESVLVVEELTPFVEDWVSLQAFRSGRQIPIYGKETGHFPLEFEYGPDLVEDALRRYLGLASRPRAPKATLSVPELPPRPPVLCAGCPHRTSFYLARKVFGKKTVYCNDIGCYTLGYGEPLDSADVLLCMGSSISQASGIARTTASRTVAYIGDSTFFHSGLPALVNAVQAGDPITVVILNNYVTAMTGFQPSPTGTKRPVIEDTVRGLGVQEIYSVDPFDEAEALEALRKARGGDGVNVVVFNSPCVVNEARLGIGAARAPYVIDEALCNACSLCVRQLGCPAIFVEDGRYFIDPDLCDGCDLCARLCSQDAILPRPDHERRT
jgi:indolepyruvate ferredoxin oxidoreductase alpha subunit